MHIYQCFFEGALKHLQSAPDHRVDLVLASVFQYVAHLTRIFKLSG